MSRADKETLERKKSELYSDFTTNFDQNPVSGLLAKVTNEDSVKQSIRNLMLTSIGERFYDSNKGSKIRQSLFDIVDLEDIEIIKIQAREAIRAYEPRANLIDLRIDEAIDSNGYNMTFVFSIINIPNTFDLTITVARVR